MPDGLDASLAAALGFSAVASWTALARTGTLQTGESVTLWGPVIPAAKDARVVHVGNSAGAQATLAGPATRENGVRILTYAVFSLSARERIDAFTRPAQHAAAGT